MVIELIQEFISHWAPIPFKLVLDILGRAVIRPLFPIEPWFTTLSWTWDICFPGTEPMRPFPELEFQSAGLRSTTLEPLPYIPACSTFAETLWWTILFWSSLTMSIPSSNVSCSRSSCGSESRFSVDSLNPLTKVPLEDLTSLIQILPVASAQTTACCLESTLESKYPLVAVGTVFAFVCRPILNTSGKKGTLIHFRWNAPVIGSRARVGGGSDWLSAVSSRPSFFCDWDWSLLVKGTKGDTWCTADMVEEADWPDEGVDCDWAFAVDIPDTASVFEDGQSPFAFFFRGPGLAWSPSPAGDPFSPSDSEDRVKAWVDSKVAVDDADFVRSILMRVVNMIPFVLVEWYSPLEE